MSPLCYCSRGNFGSSPSCCTIWTLVSLLSGLLLTSTSLWLYTDHYPALVKHLLIEHIVLQPDTPTSSPAYARFEKSTIPRTLKLYFFNITNADEYDYSRRQFPLTRLKIKETGPYIYDVAWQKRRIGFDRSGNTISYTQVKTYSFSSSQSGNRTEDDLVSVANIGLTFTKEDQNELKFSDTLAHSLVFTESVANIGFDGIRSMGNVSLFCAKGESCALAATIATGRQHLAAVGTFLSFDGSSRISIWSNTTGANASTKCTSLNGTDGAQFAPLQSLPNPSQRDQLTLFEPALCRAILYERTKGGNYVNGIWTIAYIESPANYKHLPENECYCLEKDFNQCEADLVNLRLCRRHSVAAPFRSSSSSSSLAPVGLNLYASTPYWQFNRDLLKYVNLKRPEENGEGEEYLSRVDVEPTTGIVIRSVRRLQLNVAVKRDLSTSPTQLASQYDYLPLLWFEESWSLDDGQVAALQREVLDVMFYWQIGIYLVMAIGSGLLVLGLGCFWYCCTVG